MNLNRLIYLYINERVLNRPVGNISTKKKLQYTHGLEIQEEDGVNLEELMLREEDGKDEELTDVDDIKILRACPQGSKRVRVE